MVLIFSSRLTAQAGDAPTVLVGTHLDEKCCTDAYIKKVSDYIEEFVGSRFPQVFALRCLSGKTGKGIDHLTNTILKYTEQLPYIPERIPNSYIQLEKEVCACIRMNNRAVALWNDNITQTTGESDEGVNAMPRCAARGVHTESLELRYSFPLHSSDVYNYYVFTLDGDTDDVCSYCRSSGNGDGSVYAFPARSRNHLSFQHRRQGYCDLGTTMDCGHVRHCC